MVAVKSQGETNTLVALGTRTREQPEGSPWDGNAIPAKALVPGLGGSPKQPFRAAFVIWTFRLRPAYPA